MPGPDQMSEVEERRRDEEQVKRLNEQLERRVRERTLQLESANAQLAEFTAALDKTQTIIQKLDGTILYWNSGAEILYGWSREEALGRKSHELLESELPQPFAEIQAELLAHDRWSGEFRQRRREGSFIWVASTWALYRDAEGLPVSVAKVNNDIPELKRVSEATRLLFDNASQAILTADKEGRIVDANSMALTLFGYPAAELVGLSIEMLLPERFRSRHVAHRAAYTLRPQTRSMGLGMDLVARRKDGSEFPVEISLSYATEYQSGSVAMAFISDITVRKRADEERESLIGRLEIAVSEKTVLLKEVHHRVKNNLAVIAGLLGMQADVITDPHASLALAESQQRVLSMALIHEYLYATEHLDRVNFGNYAEELTNELAVSYALQAGQVDVAINAEPLEVPVHRAIPCGLILNELLSNAFKYGFPNGRSGEIRVKFARLESGMLLLSCGDDGVGIPEGFDWQNPKSLGLRIIGILTKQIDGELTLDRSHGGTLFELRFPPGHNSLNPI